MLHWLLYLLLIPLLVASLLINIISLPGLWLMLLFVALYGACTHWTYVTLPPLLILFALALIAEIVEFLAAGASAKRAGAGKLGSLGAVLGGFLGAIFLSFLIPIFPIGTIVGILLGSFLGAAILELVSGSHPLDSLRIGTAATKGRIVGTLFKLAFGLLMLLISLYAAFPHNSHTGSPPNAAPLILPTTTTTTRAITA